MKKIFLTCLVGTSCIIAFNVMSDNAPTVKPKLTPEGRTIIEKGQKIPIVDSVNIMGVGTLIIKQSNDQSLELEAEEKVLPLVEISVKDNALYIQLKESDVDEGTKINYLLSIKDLKIINTFGNTGVTIPRTFTTSNLNLNIKGSGDSNLKLMVDKLAVSISGGAKVTAIGNAADQMVAIDGAGIFYGEKLLGKNMKVTINGAGVARTHAVDKLDVNISGVGELKYCEKPIITKTISGTAEVNPLSVSDCEL